MASPEPSTTENVDKPTKGKSRSASEPGAKDAGRQLDVASGAGRPAAKRIVVAWQGSDISDLARSLAVFAPRGSSVTVVSEEKPEVCNVLQTGNNNSSASRTSCLIMLSKVFAAVIRPAPSWRSLVACGHCFWRLVLLVPANCSLQDNDRAYFQCL